MTLVSWFGPVTVEGVGIHTGKPCRVTIESGRETRPGIRFIRDGISVPANTEYVIDTTRCTRLEADNTSVATVEHLMSAFAGLGIDSADVHIDGPELPILDGSADAWVKVISKSGIRRDGIEKAVQIPWSRLHSTPISEPIMVEGKNGSYIKATPSDKLRITLSIIYDHPVIGTQTATFVEGEDDYEAEIASARTFGLRSEVDALLAAGLAKGGSLDNAIVVEDDGYSTPLRFPNELARHKILDLLGDLYLSGSLPRADIIAVKPSHTLNVALAAKLRAAEQLDKLLEAKSC
ncbi:MAG: UDP-3-O-acyl-N-acetylglucosamine deacetylase [Armatimonas sp.]